MDKVKGVAQTAAATSTAAKGMMSRGPRAATAAGSAAAAPDAAGAMAAADTMLESAKPPVVGGMFRRRVKDTSASDAPQNSVGSDNAQKHPQGSGKFLRSWVNVDPKTGAMMANQPPTLRNRGQREDKQQPAVGSRLRMGSEVGAARATEEAWQKAKSAVMSGASRGERTKSLSGFDADDEDLLNMKQKKPMAVGTAQGFGQRDSKGSVPGAEALAKWNTLASKSEKLEAFWPKKTVSKVGKFDEVWKKAQETVNQNAAATASSSTSGSASSASTTSAHSGEFSANTDSIPVERTIASFVGIGIRSDSASASDRADMTTKMWEQTKKVAAHEADRLRPRESIASSFSPRDPSNLKTEIAEMYGLTTGGRAENALKKPQPRQQRFTEKKDSSQSRPMRTRTRDNRVNVAALQERVRRDFKEDEYNRTDKTLAGFDVSDAEPASRDLVLTRLGLPSSGLNAQSDSTEVVDVSMRKLKDLLGLLPKDHWAYSHLHNVSLVMEHHEMGLANREKFVESTMKLLSELAEAAEESKKRRSSVVI